LTGTVTITDNAGTQTVSLTGTVAIPAVTLSAASLTFASQAPGTSSAAQTVMVTNSGTATLTFASIVISGDYTQTNTCGTGILAGAACTISVTFSPPASASG